MSRLFILKAMKFICYPEGGGGGGAGGLVHISVAVLFTFLSHRSHTASPPHRLFVMAVFTLESDYPSDG